MKGFCEYFYLPYRLVRNLLVFLCILLIFAFGMAFFTYQVNEKEAAIVYRMGELVSVESEPGLHFTVPGIFQIEKLPLKHLYFDVSKSEVLTKDKKNYVVDDYAIWHIQDVGTFVRTAKRVTNAQEQLNSVVYGATKTVLGQKSQDSLIGVGYDTGRDSVNQEIKEMANLSLKELGIEIVAAEIKALDVPSENESAIYSRMISERTQSAEAFRAEGELTKSQIINAADKEIAIVKAMAEQRAEELNGEAEAEYMRIWAAAYDTPEKVEFYRFMRSLEAMENALRGDKGKTLILSSESELAKIIAGE